MAEVGVGTALSKKRRGLKNFGVNNFEELNFILYTPIRSDQKFHH
tara:strand:- start:139 stop:273 length:135 start_codon:yes stop_codon:yes gene_type:complete